MEKGNSREKEFQEGEWDLPYKNIFLIENLMYNRFKLRLQRKEVPCPGYDKQCCDEHDF